jgi:hypothetical protein
MLHLCKEELIARCNQRFAWLTRKLRFRPLCAFGLGGCSPSFGLRAPCGCLPRKMLSMSAAASIDSSRSARRGPDPLPPNELRTFTVSVRLNGAELAALDGQRAPVQMQRGEYLRCASLHRLPPTIPLVNQAAFIDLSRSAANLNQLAKALNESARGSPIPPPSTTDIAATLDEFRRSLIGAQLGQSDDGECEE